MVSGYRGRCEFFLYSTLSNIEKTRKKYKTLCVWVLFDYVFKKPFTKKKSHSVLEKKTTK
jgi:hypothetical protein